MGLVVSAVFNVYIEWTLNGGRRARYIESVFYMFVETSCSCVSEFLSLMILKLDFSPKLGQISIFLEYIG